MIFSILLPCFNEVLALPKVLADLESLLHALRSGLSHAPEILGQKILSLEVLFIDDGSTDGSADLIENWMRSQDSEWNLRLLRQRKNLGYGSALIRGISEAQGSWVGIYDCDATLDPKNLFDLGKSLRVHDIMGIGLRLHPNAEMPLHRKIGNQFFVVLVHLLYGDCPKDLTSGMRVLNRQWGIDRLPLLGPGLDFTLRLSLLALREKAGISEVEVPYRVRMGRSKLSALREGWKFLMTIFYFRCRVLKHV